MPATESLTGITALAALSEEDLKAHLGHFCGKSAKRADSKERRLIDEVRRELESFGSVARGDLFIQGIGAVCVPVETQYSNESMTDATISWLWLSALRRPTLRWPFKLSIALLPPLACAATILATSSRLGEDFLYGRPGYLEQRGDGTVWVYTRLSPDTPEFRNHGI